ncbi:MAG: MepB family protein [Cyclobacteriaceae bacterium]
MGNPTDLLLLQRHVFDPCDFKYTLPQKETESAEYEAHFFKLNDLTVRYRKAKITPTKTGQFVTFWKREGDSPIQPYQSSDIIDLLIVSVCNDYHSGVFVFSRAVLISQDIISTETKEGKRAFRVYPPWDLPMSKQAIKTQKWQLEYFLDVGVGNVNTEKVTKLFS